VIQLHAERSPTLLDLSPQTNSMPTQHDGSAGFAEYLDKMLGRGVFSTPLQNGLPDVSYQPASYAVANDERLDAAARHETAAQRDLMAKHEAAEKQSAANSAARAEEVARSTAASKAKAESDEATRNAAEASVVEDSPKASAASTTDQSEDKLKAAAEFSVALEAKNSKDQALTEDHQTGVRPDKAASDSSTSNESIGDGALIAAKQDSGDKDSGQKDDHGLEAQLVEGAKGLKAENVLETGKEEILGKQLLRVSEDAAKDAAKDASKDAHSLSSRTAGVEQGARIATESLVSKGSQESGDTGIDKLSAAKSQARGSSDPTREPRDDEKANALVRQATSADRDEKAQRVAAGSVASLAGEKPDVDNGRTRSRVRTEIVVDLSKYETASESDKTGNKQSGGESRGGEQDGRNSFSARLDGFGGTDSASGRSASTGSDFASQLSRRLQGDAGAEIVRHAQMVVRGKESGEMRLVLRPENLGSVRVRMQMEDGLITVRFLVENNGVRQALEQNLAGLQQAFKDAGLETGSLDVSVGNGGNGDAEQQDQGDSARRDVHRLSAAVPGISEFGFPEHAVDLIA